MTEHWKKTNEYCNSIDGWETYPYWHRRLRVCLFAWWATWSRKDVALVRSLLDHECSLLTGPRGGGEMLTYHHPWRKCCMIWNVWYGKMLSGISQFHAMNTIIKNPDTLKNYSKSVNTWLRHLTGLTCHLDSRRAWSAHLWKLRACREGSLVLAPSDDPGLPDHEDSGHQNVRTHHGPHVSCLLKNNSNF